MGGRGHLRDSQQLREFQLSRLLVLWEALFGEGHRNEMSLGWGNFDQTTKDLELLFSKS